MTAAKNMDNASMELAFANLDSMVSIVALTPVKEIASNMVNVSTWRMMRTIKDLFTSELLVLYEGSKGLLGYFLYRIP